MRTILLTLSIVVAMFIAPFSVNATNIAVTSYPVAQTGSICQGGTFQAMELKLENVSGNDSIQILDLSFSYWSTSLTIIDSIFIIESTGQIVSKTRMINGSCNPWIGEFIKTYKNYKVFAKTTSTGIGNSYCQLTNIRSINGMTFLNDNINYTFNNQPYLYNCFAVPDPNFQVTLKLDNDGVTIKNGDTISAVFPFAFSEVPINIDQQSINRTIWYVNDSVVKNESYFHTSVPLNLYIKLGKNKIAVRIFNQAGQMSYDSFFVYLKPRIINVSIQSDILFLDTVCFRDKETWNIWANIENYQLQIRNMRWIHNGIIIKEGSGFNVQNISNFKPKIGLNTLSFSVYGQGVDSGIKTYTFIGKIKPFIKLELKKSIICVGEEIPFSIINNDGVKDVFTNSDKLYSATNRSGFITKPGKIDIYVEWNAGCLSDTTIDIKGAPAQEKPVLISQGCTIFTNTIAKNYLWYMNNSAIIGISEPSIVAQKSGFYYVTTENEYGCKAKSDAIAVTCGTSNIGKVSASTISINQNPVENILKVNSEKEETFELFNSLGQKIINGETNTDIFVSELSSGLYVIKTSDGETINIFKN